MSRGFRIPDAERTAAMFDLVRREYPGEGGVSLSHVVVQEVAPGTGFSAAQRWADLVALAVWPSQGLTLDGYEIKASRADLRKELSDPSKHEAVARYCDTWTLVAWDESVLVEGIPEWWGILLTVEGADGRELKTHRKAAKREPLPWPREFVCSLTRNAYQQSPGAQYVARASVTANKMGRKEGEQIANGDWLHALKPLCVALYGKDEWKWPTIKRDEVFKLAAERLTQLALEPAP